MPHPPIPHTPKSDVSDVLNTWLNRMMKTYILSIDTKLERLLTNVESNSKDGVTYRSEGLTYGSTRSNRNSCKIANKRSIDTVASRNSCSRLAELAELAELKKIGMADGTVVQGLRMSVATTGSTLPSPLMWRNKNAAEEIPDITRKTLQDKGAEEIREIITEYTKKRGCIVHAWRFLEYPNSSAWARIYAVVMAACTILSVFVTFWQSVQGGALSRSHASIINFALEIAFSIEILVRFTVSPDRKAFWHNLYNYIDLISSLPLPYRGVAMVLGRAGIEHDADEFLSKVAVLPVLRLFRLMRHFESFQLLLSAFLIAIEVLPVLLYTLSIIALVFSALIRIVEPSENIENLPQALWFVFVTMTTVGYGDVTPETTMGRMVTSMLMIISMLYMAIPIGIVGNAFSQVWEARDRLLVMRRMREALVHYGFNAQTLRDIVAVFDLDGDGVFSLEEFKALLNAMHINMSDDRVLLLMDSMDENGCGSIDLDELMKGLFPRDFRGLLDSMALKNAARCDRDISSPDTSFSPSSTVPGRPSNSPVVKVYPSAIQVSADHLYTRQATIGRVSC